MMDDSYDSCGNHRVHRALEHSSERAISSALYAKCPYYVALYMQSVLIV